MIDFPENRSLHYRKLAMELRALAQQALFPSARRALASLANRFTQSAEHTDSARPDKAA